MSYLSYKNGSSASASPTIDGTCLFQPSGNLYSLSPAATPGYIVTIVGTVTPGGFLLFDQRPVNTVAGAVQLNQFGTLEPQADGSVAVVWPL